MDDPKRISLDTDPDHIDEELVSKLPSRSRLDMEMETARTAELGNLLRVLRRFRRLKGGGDNPIFTEKIGRWRRGR